MKLIKGSKQEQPKGLDAIRQEPLSEDMSREDFWRRSVKIDCKPKALDTQTLLKFRASVLATRRMKLIK
jgi:hypothetical protein